MFSIMQNSVLKKALIFCILFLLSFSMLAQDQNVISSAYLSKPDSIVVYKPQNVDSRKKYPVLFLLHGYGGNHKQWSNIIDLQHYADQFGWFIVCPDGQYESWYIESKVKPNSQYVSFFFKDLFPYIQKNYPVSDKKVFISGLSMGGHGALYLFSQHPELFLAIGSTSGVVDLTQISYLDSSLQKVLGSKSENLSEWESSSVLNLAEHWPTTKPLILDCGTQDGLYNSNLIFKNKLENLHIPVTFISQPGAHNRAYWANSIGYHFLFFNKILQGL
jgi:S-formylglutathione hydrolase FrmB